MGMKSLYFFPLAAVILKNKMWTILVASLMVEKDKKYTLHIMAIIHSILSHYILYDPFSIVDVTRISDFYIGLIGPLLSSLCIDTKLSWIYRLLIPLLMFDAWVSSPFDEWAILIGLFLPILAWFISLINTPSVILAICIPLVRLIPVSVFYISLVWGLVLLGCWVPMLTHKPVITGSPLSNEPLYGDL